MKKDVLNRYGYLDVLPYYSEISRYIKKFLKGKEIATKTWLPGFFFLKRGSKSKPLFIEDFSSVNEKMLKLRDKDLKSVRQQLSEKQALIWEYFVPRKLVDFFYATNNENPGKPIERIFIDIDRGTGISSEQAQEVSKLLIEEIKKDKQLKKIIKFKLFILWTGSSFHVYLMLSKSINNPIYNKYFSYSKNTPLESFIGRWVAIIQKKVKFKISGGHEKINNGINIDPSQTPSGKLARAPFSLHMKSNKEVDGVALPVNEKDLSNKSLIKMLKSYTPDKVIKDIKRFAKLLL
ncbi:hypothetical protein HZA33_01305, partial [Candidatus Pacearchaeota archaeon]|nr:hypothetical protein [Candidatus Pacearchaeota archaeon]